MIKEFLTMRWVRTLAGKSSSFVFVKLKRRILSTPLTLISMMRELLAVRWIRSFVGKARLFFFLKVKRKLLAAPSLDALDLTIEHNLKSLSVFNSPRMDKLLRPLSVIETVFPWSSVLVIGPRNEGDLLHLIGLGFLPESIRGLDLISYSPMVDLGDMHAMPYDDSSFDVVVCGWTLSYSKNPNKVAHELIRVAKNGGIIAIGIEYSEMTREQEEKISGYSLYDDKSRLERVNSVAQIHTLFKGHIDYVYFQHDAPLKISHGDTIVHNVSSVVTIFSITK